jgi:glycosyltransferase involved in cell wall biosynthesis
MAILEAMACEVPCVVTEVGDVPQAVGAGGRFVPVQSPGRLAEEIGWLLRQSPEDRRSIGRAGRARATSHFSLDSAAAAYQDLHASLAGEWGLKSRPVVG